MKKIDLEDYDLFEKLKDDECLTTYSDAGSLKIGSGDMTILIPNGYGDGITKTLFLLDKEFDCDSFQFFTSVEGKIDIYSSDCGNEIVKTIIGRYGIFFRDSIIIFVEWK